MPRASSLRFPIFVALALVAGGCKLTEKESEKTHSQLSKLARDIGADGAVTEVEKAYVENVQPLVNSATSSANQYTEDFETLRAARETTAQVGQKLSETGQSISISIDRATRKMPQTEDELVQMVDDYTEQFAGWLRMNFISTKSLTTSRSTDKNTRNEPRRRPKTSS